MLNDLCKPYKPFAVNENVAVVSCTFSSEKECISYIMTSKVYVLNNSLIDIGSYSHRKGESNSKEKN